MNASTARSYRVGIQAARDDMTGAHSLLRPLRGKQEWRAYWRTLHALIDALRARLVAERIARSARQDD